MSDFIWVEKYRPQKIEDCMAMTQFFSFLASDSINFIYRGTYTIAQVSNNVGNASDVTAKMVYQHNVKVIHHHIKL